jgi:outer membrane protein assembly factor BamB
MRLSRRRALLGCAASLTLAGCSESATDDERSPSDGTATPTDDATGTTPGPTDSDVASLPSPVDSDREHVDWELPLPDDRSSLAVGGDRAYVGLGQTNVLEGGDDGDGAVLAVGPDGTVPWRYDTDRPVERVVAAGDTVYVVTGRRATTLLRDAAVHAVDVTDGTRRWRRTETPPGDFLFVLGVADGTLVVGYSNDNLTAEGHSTVGLSTANGRQRWSVPTGDVTSGTVDGAAFVADPGHVRAIDPVSGDEQWERAASTPLLHGLTPDAAVTGDSTIRALDRSDGEARWTYDDAEGLDGATVLDGRVYTDGGTVVALAGDGTERWRYAAGGTVRVTGADAVFGIDRATLPSDTSDLFAVDEGEQRWRREVPTDRFHLVGIRDDCPLGRSEGTLYVLDPATGDVRTMVELGAAVSGPSSVGGRLVAADGSRVYGLAL